MYPEFRAGERTIDDVTRCSCGAANKLIATAGGGSMWEGLLGMFAAHLRSNYDLTRLEMVSVHAGLMDTLVRYEIRDQWGGE